MEADVKISRGCFLFWFEVNAFCYSKKKLYVVCRIVDNMPVTWCYDVEDSQKYCNPGFPIGCLVTFDGRSKDACVINVSKLFAKHLLESGIPKLFI